MDTLAPREITMMFLALGILLFCARALGELVRRCNQPSVLGEILAGILLGPTVLGVLAPGLSAALFPVSGGGAVMLEGLTTLAIVLFLLVAGMEINLSTVWRQGKAALLVALLGMLVPFSLGFSAAWWLPGLMGYRPGSEHLPFALFMATALSISALPIIVKILMDLNIYRSDLGVTVVAAAVCNDILGWLVFAVILGMVGGHGGVPIGHTIWMTLVFTLAMLTVVPWLIHRILPWLQAYTSWPAGVLGFALTLCLLAAAFTEWLGIHAIFGSFLAGVALGQSRHLKEQTRTTLDEFVSFIFAPLFFASIGLKVNFATHFNPWLILSVLVLAFTGKVVGSVLGGRLGGLSWRESWGAGVGMSAQGTMGIILGVLALQIGLISQEVFVALVVMALVTSLVSGPLLQWVLRLKKPRSFDDYLDSSRFLRPLNALNRVGVIKEITDLLAETEGIDAEAVRGAVWDRERIMATGIGMGVAVPHARVEGLKADGIPAQVICMILSPMEDNGAQLEIQADIAATFRNGHLLEKVLQVSGYTEFLSLIRSERKG